MTMHGAGRPKGVSMSVNPYEVYSYCKSCGEWREKIRKYCPECSTLLRHKPRGKKSGVKRIA